MHPISPSAGRYAGLLLLLAAALLSPPAHADRPPACPDAGFAQFLARFASDAAVQRRSSADPLLHGHIDVNAEPEPVPVQEPRALDALQWPVFPDPAGFGQTRSMHVSDAGDGGMQVMVRREGSSDQQVYTFRRQPCWTLVELFDESI